MRLATCLFLLFVRQVLALIIDIGGTVGSVSAYDFLNVTDTYLLSDCHTECDNASCIINSCGMDDRCFCSTTTVTAITTCQQCMFNDLVAKFTTSTDPRAGSVTALAAYATACAGLNITVPKSLVTLMIPLDWDGPFQVELSIGETIVTVTAATVLSGAALFVLLSL